MISNCLSFLVSWPVTSMVYVSKGAFPRIWKAKRLATELTVKTDNHQQEFDLGIPIKYEEKCAGYYTWYWILLTKIYQKYSSYYKCLVTVNFAFSYFYFLQNAVNLTSTLVRKASTADSKVNILVSFEKLEVFAMNYASLHLTPQNGSEREISIEQKELGIALFVTIYFTNYSCYFCLFPCLFVCLFFNLFGHQWSWFHVCFFTGHDWLAAITYLPRLRPKLENDLMSLTFVIHFFLCLLFLLKVCQWWEFLLITKVVSYSRPMLILLTRASFKKRREPLRFLLACLIKVLKKLSCIHIFL